MDGSPDKMCMEMKTGLGSTSVLGTVIMETCAERDLRDAICLGSTQVT
jgi:hypothetical protein